MILSSSSSQQASCNASVVPCREGGKGVEVLHTVYQYNHQSGTLYLPLRSGPSSPVAIKVRGQLHSESKGIVEDCQS